MIHFETNSYLESVEKKHPKLFLALYVLIPIFSICAGVWCLVGRYGEKASAIFLIAVGVLALLCALFLHFHKK